MDAYIYSFRSFYYWGKHCENIDKKQGMNSNIGDTESSKSLKRHIIEKFFISKIQYKTIQKVLKERDEHASNFLLVKINFTTIAILFLKLLWKVDININIVGVMSNSKLNKLDDGWSTFGKSASTLTKIDD